MRYHAAVIDTAIGRLCIGTTESGQLVRCGFARELSRDELVAAARLRRDEIVWNEAACGSAILQLREYFAGTRNEFDLQLDLRGTEFQRKVWRTLQMIPFGETVSYSWVAQKIGNVNAVRAVGAANGANPVAVIVPCHRVIGSSGALVGYGGGMNAKKILLKHERSQRGLF